MDRTGMIIAASRVVEARNLIVKWAMGLSETTFLSEEWRSALADLIEAVHNLKAAEAQFDKLLGEKK